MHQPKQRANIRMPIPLVCFFFLIVSQQVKAVDTIPSPTVHFTFTLPAAAKTSAGVYTSDSTLVKTLWSGVTYTAGTYNGSWDGATDDSQRVANGTYYVKVLSNNVSAVWEGTIGNNSDSLTGGTIQRGFDRISGMAIAGQYAYTTKNYSEGNPSQLKFNLNTPRQRIQIMPAGQGMGQASLFVATDGPNVYWAGYDAHDNYNFIFATRTSNDSEVLFSAGRSYKCYAGRTYPSVIDTINNVNGTVAGLAVQYNGNFLFASHSILNELHVLNKTTGAVVQNLSYTNPGALAVDSSGNLWMAYTSGGTRRVEKFTVDTNGLLTATGIVLPGIVEPVAISCAPDNQTVVVADAGTSQQLKGYNSATGVADWTYGQAGGYATGPNLSNDKFYFSDLRGTLGSFIAYQPNGSFWVGDPGNARAQHYTPSRSFLDRIQYIPHFYSCFVDPNNPERVFADYMEYKIDYTKSLARNNGSWTMVRNWGYNITTALEDHNNRLRCVTTLSNGRTYALAYNTITSVTKKWQVVELPGTSNLRFTGVFIPINSGDLTQLYPDGSLRKLTRTLTLGTVSTWSKKNLTGFDANNNPIWGADSIQATTPPATFKDPGWFGNQNKVKTGEVSSTGVVVAFDGGNVHAGWNNYHLGGIKKGTDKWLWRTAMSTLDDYTGPFPPEGTYDIGNGVKYSGVSAMASGRTIFWGYHGEFWKNSQTNKWNIVYDNGLFVNQFGVTGPEVAGQEAPYGMAGNAYSANIVRMGDTAFLYHNDEGHHGGVHRWRITGLNNIQVQTVAVNFTDTGRGLATTYYNGADMNNMNNVVSRIDSMVYIDKSGVNLADTNNFSVSYTGFIQPLYTENYRIYTAANKGVRLWVGHKLLVDQRNATTAAEYSDTIRLTAGLRYPVRLEVYHTGGASAASLSWSSTSQAKTAIPTSQLNPAELPDYSNGYNLLEKLTYHTSLENNMYGWTRNPVNDISVNQYTNWWNVKTGVKSYNRLQPDLNIKFVIKDTINAFVSRDFGMAANGVPGWQISGVVNYEGNLPNEDTVNLGTNTNKGGSFLEVLDDQGKILVRIFWNSGYNSGYTKLYVNNKLMASGASAALKAIYSIAQPLQISMTGDSAIVQYGPFTAIKVARFDVAAHWNKPKNMRLYCFSVGGNSGRMLDIENIKFMTLATGSRRQTEPGNTAGSVIANSTGKLKLYPNPMSGSRFYIQYKDAVADAMTVTVTDLQGRVLFSKKYGATEQGLYPVNFNIRPKPGIYLVIMNGRHAEMLAVH